MGKTIISEDGRFEWDEDKAVFNLKKHGLAFDEILPVFDDPRILEFYDDSHSTDTEDRMRGIGSLEGVLVLYACYTERGRRTRIYSVRKARSKEEAFTMNGSKKLTPERIAEIKAFIDEDISDCPELTDEELKKLRPRHPEYFKPVKRAVQIRLDADVLAWFKGYGKGYQSRINSALRDVMLQNMQGQA